MLHAYASLPHHVRHLTPILDELDRRGVRVQRWSKWGDGWPLLRAVDRQAVRTVLVAGWYDAHHLFPDAEVIYVEHGAGQRYVGVDGHGYPGAPGLDHVRLFVCPNDDVAFRWRTRYPRADVAVVGSPVLDGISRGMKSAGKSVAVSFHWECHVCPETMPALPAYRHALPGLLTALAAQGVEVVGHAHPRAQGQARALWRTLGVRYEPDPDRILQTASLLIADNTSLMYEAAALDVPVLTLNAPWYRRHVEHGLRFWKHIPGLTVDRDADLIRKTFLAYEDGPLLRALRVRAAGRAYSSVDGLAASRAADAIQKVTDAP